jgi:very-short-patch-repair endonuclease
MIATRIASGRLIRVHRGVYAVDHLEPVPLADESAALLACGEGAVLSHATAASLWGILPRQAGAVHVTAHGHERGRAIAGIQLHRARALTDGDVGSAAGLPVTSPARTLHDVAPCVSDYALERALDEALARGLVSRTKLTEELDHASGRGGGALLRRLIADRTIGTGVSRSRANARFLAMVRAAGLPDPQTNLKLGAFEADFYWPRAQVAVEVDGYQWHSTRSAFERDRRKDAAFREARIDLTRVTWVQMDDEPLAVVARLARSIAERTRRPAA